MKTAFICQLAFILEAPSYGIRDFLVPVTIASLILAAVFCFRLPHKVERFLTGLAAVLFFYPIVGVSFSFAPRTSVACFSLIAFPVVLFAYYTAWQRKWVTIIAVTGVVAFAASPIDFAVDFHAEKKGVHVVPVGYSISGGFQGSYYSRGCLTPPSSIYSASHVLVLSL